MPQLSANQARELGKEFFQLSKSLGDYRFDNWDKLTKSQRDSIEDFEWTLLNYSSDFTARAIRVTLEDLQATLGNIRRATNDMDQAIHRLKQVNKIIGIAAAAIKLAAAVATSNVNAIATALDEAATVVS